MRTLLRNKRSFYYALYNANASVTDDCGNRVGSYENPVQCRANISAANGGAINYPFGRDETYEKTIVMGSDAPPFDVHTVLWIDTVPRLDENGALAVNEQGDVITPFDYVVECVSRSLNNVSINIRKVDVS